MANPEHLQILKQGVEAWNQWRHQNRDITPDLSEADLSLTGLSKANLSEANLAKADLGEADLSGANFWRADLARTRLSLANLTRATLVEATLSKASLDSADLSGADFWRADLSGANLRVADLFGAHLWEADLSGADLTWANLRGVNMQNVRGAYYAEGLETTQFAPRTPKLKGSPQAPEQAEPDPKLPRYLAVDYPNDTFDFETCVRSWPERWLDWERLRIVGRLPLFGISYTALILLPVIFYGLALYNDKIELIRTWAEQLSGLPDSLPSRLGPLILERLHRLPIPSQSFLLLLSTLFLAVGSTLYTLFCPSRIKEFSRDQWCDQLGRPLLHYWALAWKHRYLRIASTACYAFGGVGALWVLGTKVWRTALFILRHSTFP